MKHNSTLKIILTALFAALVCVTTMLVAIPIPATGGYANLGDGVILLGAFLMSPVCAVSAAGIGSMLADVLTGYMSFAPGTLVIKGCMALIAALIFNRFGREARGKKGLYARLTGALAAEIFMVLGYFFYEAVILRIGIGAAGGIPGNIGQGIVGILTAMVLMPLLSRSRDLMEIMDKTRH